MQVRKIDPHVVMKVCQHVFLDICLLQRNVEDVHVRDSIRALGRRAEIIHFDASDQASVRTVMDRILQVFPTLDILVNNAGIALRHE